MAAHAPTATAVPFETAPTWIGKEGLQLNKPIDDLTMQEVSRIANLWHSGSGLTTRLGQTLLATLAGTVHSIRRLNDPKNSTYTRFWGASTFWYRGQSGVPTALDAGLSGNPLTLIPVRPPFSGEPWMLMADSLAMRKASRTIAGSLPVGLPAPSTPTVITKTAKTQAICQFAATDGTAAASWTKYGAAAVPDQAPQQADPTLSDVAGTVGSAVNLQSYSANAAPTGSNTWPDPPGPGTDSGAG